MLFVLLLSILILIALQIKGYSFNFRTILSMILGIIIGIAYNAMEIHSDEFIQTSDILGNGIYHYLRC